MKHSNTDVVHGTGITKQAPQTQGDLWSLLRHQAGSNGDAGVNESPLVSLHLSGVPRTPTTSVARHCRKRSVHCKAKECSVTYGASASPSRR